MIYTYSIYIIHVYIYIYVYKYKCERGNEYRDMDRHEVGDIGVFSV